jgi:hypothetical protein
MIYFLYLNESLHDSHTGTKPETARLDPLSASRSPEHITVMIV